MLQPHPPKDGGRPGSKPAPIPMGMLCPTTPRPSQKRIHPHTHSGTILSQISHFPTIQQQQQLSQLLPGPHIPLPTTSQLFLGASIQIFCQSFIPASTCSPHPAGGPTVSNFHRTLGLVSKAAKPSSALGPSLRLDREADTSWEGMSVI